jgi:V/A-type H+/Na+-transporting ATPase subunit K
MKFKLAVIFTTLAVMLVGGSLLYAAETSSAKTEEAPAVNSTRGAAAMLAAGIAGGLSILGAGIAVGRVGSAGVGAVAEKPEFFVRALIFVVIAEGLAGLGFGLAFVLTKL